MCFGGGLCLQGEGWREEKKEGESAGRACSRAGAGEAAVLACLG